MYAVAIINLTVGVIAVVLGRMEIQGTSKETSAEEASAPAL